MSNAVGDSKSHLLRLRLIVHLRGRDFVGAGRRSAPKARKARISHRDALAHSPAPCNANVVRLTKFRRIFVLIAGQSGAKIAP